MKAIATRVHRVIDPEVGRDVTVYADEAGEYCAWFFGEHAPNLLGREMDLPYRVDLLIPRFWRRPEFSTVPKLRLIARRLLIDYETFNFEIAPEEWVTAA